MSALHLDAGQVFTPLILPMAMACVATIGVAWYLGLKERARLKRIEWKPDTTETSPIGGNVDLDASEGPRTTMAKKVFNLLLTVGLMVCLILAVLPLPLLFMGAFAIAMSVNFPSIKDQKERISAHAASALSVVSVIFAAGVFTGILSGTKMRDF